MKTQMTKVNSGKMRSRFDFSKAVRGKFHERYKKGQTVALLEG